jgi:hypothetical protein
MVGIASGQPLDTLRVRLQQQSCQHTSVAEVWRSMAKTEGIRGLFKGMSYPIYTTALQVSTSAVSSRRHRCQLTRTECAAVSCMYSKCLRQQAPPSE